MEQQAQPFTGIYCENEQHYQTGELIQYLMIKKDKGSIQKRLFCNKCYLGEYASCQQYCCDLNELLKGNIFEAFKTTKFDSETMQMFFNYLSRLHLYLNEDNIKEIIYTLRAEIESAIEDLESVLLERSRVYKKYLADQNYDQLCGKHFNNHKLVQIFQQKFYRNPLNWDTLNSTVENYVEQINKTEIDKRIEEKIVKTIEQQQNFFNLERFSNGLKELLSTVQEMQNKTLTSYQFSQSTLATPYIEQVLDKISVQHKERIYKTSKKLYRLTQNGRDYTQLQQIRELKDKNTLTIIQTKNRQVFGVYNDVVQPQKSFLFQMNKEKIFQAKKGQIPFEINMQSSQDSWILKAGGGDIVINSTFCSCYSKLNKGYDTDGTTIFDHEEYLANSKEFDVYDLEIFEITAVQEESPKKVTPPNFQPPASVQLPVQPQPPAPVQPSVKNRPSMPNFQTLQQSIPNQPTFSNPNTPFKPN